ncbi:exported hypothetical protein [Gammaproteobacteria bacterium]
MKRPMKKFRRGAILLTILLLTRGCNPSGTPQYESVLAVRGDITQHVTASGNLSAVVSVDVGSQVSGKISTL